jgi:hypothetical protein
MKRIDRSARPPFEASLNLQGMWPWRSVEEILPTSPEIRRSGTKKGPIREDQPCERWKVCLLVLVVRTVLPLFATTLRVGIGLVLSVSRSGTSRRCTARWSQSNQYSGKHQDEAENSDNRESDTDASDQGSDADNANEHAGDDPGIGWSTVPPSCTRHEIGVVVVETALHFFKEPLLLLGKWHSVYLTLLEVTYDNYCPIVSLACLARLGACL